MARGAGAEPRAAGPPTAGAAPVSSQARQGLAHGEAAPPTAWSPLAGLPGFIRAVRTPRTGCVCVSGTCTMKHTKYVSNDELKMHTHVSTRLLGRTQGTWGPLASRTQAPQAPSPEPLVPADPGRFARRGRGRGTNPRP